MALQENQNENELLRWTFHEFNPKPRSNSWYLWFGIIFAFFVIVGIISDNFLFSIILILSALIIFLRNWRKPSDITFVITPQGVQVGQNQYTMKELKSFWIAYRPPEVQSLYFEFNSVWRPYLGVPLDGVNPLQVRDVLLKYLPENLDNDDEPVSDAIGRMLNL